MALYLISAKYQRLARLMAEEMGLLLGTEDAFIWIPYEPELQRKRALAGHKVSDPKYLVGNFSDYERRKLLCRS